MKILPRNIVTPFFLMAALSVPFATHSYCMNKSTAGGGEDEIDSSGSFGYVVPAELSSARPIIGSLTAELNEVEAKIAALKVARSAAESAALSSTNMASAGKLAIIGSQLNGLQVKLTQVQELRQFFAVADLSLGALSALRGVTITGEMLTPPNVHQGMGGYNHGYHQATEPAESTTGLAFTAGITQITTGSAIFLDTQNFQLYLPGSVNREVIVGCIKETADRFSAYQGRINHFFADLPNMWNKSLVNLEHATALFVMLPEQHSSIEATPDSDLARYFTQLRVAEEKVKEKEAIHNAMKAIKAFVDETLEYLRKNSKVS